MIYLANAFSVNMLSPMWVTEARQVRIERISAKEAGEILRSSEWRSYFGHRNSAWHLTRYLKTEIPVNRGTFSLTPGDVLLVAAVEGRRRWQDGKNGCPWWRFYRIIIEKEEINDQLRSERNVRNDRNEEG